MINFKRNYTLLRSKLVNPLRSYIDEESYIGSYRWLNNKNMYSEYIQTNEKIQATFKL